MPSSKTHSQSMHRPATAATTVLALARQLHRAATGESTAASLPVLRRLLAAGTLRELTLPELHRRRTTVQRKHLLRLLALEAGFASWEHYRQALDGMTPDQLVHFDLQRRRIGYPNLWFSSVAEAERHQRHHGGQVMAVGRQGVLVPAPQSAG